MARQSFTHQITTHKEQVMDAKHKVMSFNTADLGITEQNKDAVFAYIRRIERRLGIERLRVKHDSEPVKPATSTSEDQ